MSTKSWLSVAELLAEYQAQAGCVKQPAERAWLFEMMRWIKDEICQPHPDLDRRGDLCPFVRPALKQNLLFIEESDLDDRDEMLLESFLLESSKTFLETPPLPPQRNCIYKSLLVAFPTMAREKAIMLQSVRRSIKPTLLGTGLTCGEFYPWSEDRSVRSKDFPVARSPVPCIAIRYLSPHDIIFLRSQPELLEIYVQQYPDLVPKETT